MTEEEKMLNGDLYSPMDKDLTEKRKKAKDLCDFYNKIPSNDRIKQYQTLTLLLNINKDDYEITIEKNFYCDYGFNTSIKKPFYANHNLVILDAAKVDIDSNVYIGPNCGIYTSIHPLDRELRNKGLESAKPITIKKDVWIGGNVVILPGVTIGENSVIGAGSVVTKDIPDNSVAVGNPARVIRSNNNKKDVI